MSVRGSLKKGQLGFSMPPYAPLFPKPPYFYKNATLMVFKYVTDELAARMVPDMVDLADPPTAGLVFASYPSSNLGPYDEVVLFLDVVFKGRPLQFAAFLYVTTDAAMAAGREMGGYPKSVDRSRLVSAHRRLRARPFALGPGPPADRLRTGQWQHPCRLERSTG